jgi:uncharacterized protein YbcI
MPDDRPTAGREADHRPPDGGLKTALTNRVVQLQRRYIGRGAEKARTYVNGNLVVVVLHDSLTRGEQSLARDGKAEIVTAMRQQFQRTMRADLTAAVEEFAGRRVVAFLSDNHIDPDVGVEVFLLDQPVEGEPDGGAPSHSYGE